MTVIAHNPKTLAPPLKERIGTRCVIAWSCTRKAPRASNGRLLERIEFVLSVDPLDQSHAMIEAWLESHGAGTRTIHPSQRHRCQIVDGCGMLHIDARDDAGNCLATLSLATNGGRDSLLYAQTSLLPHAGFAAGGYDAPVLRKRAG